MLREGLSPFDHLQNVNQLPTQTKPYNKERTHPSLHFPSQRTSLSRKLRKCGTEFDERWGARFLTLLAPHSRHRDKALGVRLEKSLGVGKGLRGPRNRPLLLLWYSPGSLTRRKIWDTAELNAIQFVRGVCGTNTSAYLVQVSDQRGTCLVEKPAKGDLCL